MPSVPVGARKEIDGDRDVTRCLTCGLVQFFTKSAFCRKCLRMLPRKVEFRTLPPAPPDDVKESAPTATHNDLIVRKIGQRIRQLRESRNMTQSDLQRLSRVSRSYLSRIESGQMTPSLGTLEKISESLQVAFHRFFTPDENGELLVEDRFIQALRPFLNQLKDEQWQSIMMRLRAISGHVESAQIKKRGPTGL